MRDIGQVSRFPVFRREGTPPAFWLASREGLPSAPLSAQDDLRAEPQPAAQVLIVEDELFVAWHVEAILQDLGHVVCGIAARGEEAVEAAATLAPDIVFLDVNLGPGIDGVEAARRIRSTTPVPVVFVTAYSDTATRQRIAAAFPEAPVLAKPVSPEAIRKVLSGHFTSG